MNANQIEKKIKPLKARVATWRKNFDAAVNRLEAIRQDALDRRAEIKAGREAFPEQFAVAFLEGAELPEPAADIEAFLATNRTLKGCTLAMEQLNIQKKELQDCERWVGDVESSARELIETADAVTVRWDELGRIDPRGPHAAEEIARARQAYEKADKRKTGTESYATKYTPQTFNALEESLTKAATEGWL